MKKLLDMATANRQGGSKKSVYAALFGNLGIAITKLIAALFTASASMWSEAFHSISDTFNQVLLLIGMKTGSQPPDESHQFGHSKREFFWAFVVSVLLFGIAGLLSIFRGYISLHAGDLQEFLRHAIILYIVFGISFGFEANSLRVAYKHVSETIRSNGKDISFSTIIEELRNGRDPMIMTVIVEDSAAIAGLVIAVLAVSLSVITRNIVFDSIGSFMIGGILMSFAAFLAYENQRLLIGESLQKEEYEKVSKNIMEVPEVKRILTLKTMILGPVDVMVGVDVELIDSLEIENVESVINHIKKKIRQAIPSINLEFVFVEVDEYRKKGAT
jgi:cation diffusion facilitator family transporter